MQFLGLALATAIASWLNFVLLLKALGRRTGQSFRWHALEPYLRIGLASVLMGGVSAAAFHASASVAGNRTQLSLATNLGVAIAAGIIGAAAASVLTKVVVWVGGFVGGAYVGVIAWQTLMGAAPGFPWIPVVIGGIAGILVAKFLFESVLVIVSSAAGAALLVHTFQVGETVGFILLILFTAIGIIVQGRLWPGASSKAPKQEKEQEEKKES